MPSVLLPSPGTSASIALILDLSYTQNIAANQSTVSWHAYLQRQNNSGTGAFDSTGTSTKSLTLGGALVMNATTNWDFRSTSGLGGTGAVNELGSGSYTFNHDSTGALSVGYNLTFIDGGTKTIGDGTVAGTLVLPVIPQGGFERFRSPAWGDAYLERWNGTAWKLQALERWNGTSWVREG